MFTGTKKELLDIIKRNGTISINEVVEKMDLAKTTLREHFLQLERDGYITRDYVRSGPGRPSLKYQLTQKGNNLFPSGDAVVVKELLQYLKTKGEEQTIEEFFEAFWEKRLQKARDLMSEVGEDDLKSRFKVFKEMLEEEGFMPELTADEETGNVSIKECNCPFSEVVKETRLPCKLEAIFYKKLFSENAERTSFMGDGDYACSYSIPLEEVNL